MLTNNNATGVQSAPAQTGVEWHKVLAKIFSDQRFRSIGQFRLYGVVDGVKVGVVLATFSPTYSNYALNKNGYESLLAAKHAGKIDEAFVVATRTDGPNGRVFAGYADAESLGAKLSGLQARAGSLGAFWALPFDLTPSGQIEDPAF
jgi:hypothetical protein